MTENFKNEWTDTIDAQREAIKARDALIDAVTQENLDLTVELGRLRGLLRSINFIINRTTGHKGV
jgi:hypothetical protein